MNLQVFDGNKFAKAKEKELRRKVSKLGFTPKIVSVFFAEDEGSILYTRLKQEAAERVGINFHPEEITIHTPVESIANIVRHYSNEKSVQGLMIQKPSIEAVVDAEDVGEMGFEKWWKKIVFEINPAKDVDCLTSANLERIYHGNWEILPATVKAVMSILVEVARIENKKIAVVGRSELVGKPLAYVLAQKGAKVYLCGSSGLAGESIGSQIDFTTEMKDLDEVTKEADVVVSATGVVGLIKKEMVKEGAVVVDVGWPVGDVDFENVKEKASFITPVPGGVGPVTVACLMDNLTEVIKS